MYITQALVLSLGAHFTILSTLIISSAASLADNKADSLTRKHSVIPNSFMLFMLPVFISSPASNLPFKSSTFRCYNKSILSYPPFSAITQTNSFKALAYPSIANAYFPFTYLASSSTAIAICISAFPPPHVIFLFFIV